MEKLKVMTVFGTRPEAIKMAPLVKVLEQREEIESVVCVTAQHRQMLEETGTIVKIHPRGFRLGHYEIGANPVRHNGAGDERH